MSDHKLSLLGYTAYRENTDDYLFDFRSDSFGSSLSSWVKLPQFAKFFSEKDIFLISSSLEASPVVVCEDEKDFLVFHLLDEDGSQFNFSDVLSSA